MTKEVNKHEEDKAKKLAAFRAALKDVSKEMKDADSPVDLLPEISIDVETLPTGSLVLDGILGGGFPKGRIVEIYGENASGKTSIALTAIGEMQKAGKTCFFVDAEQAFDPRYAKTLGVNIEELGFTQMAFAEDVLTLILNLCRTKTVDMIVVDSVASLIPKAEPEDLDKSSMALLARLLSKALKKIAVEANQNGVCIIFLNQVRDNIGVMYGPKTVTTGGKAIQFYASQRLAVKKKSSPVVIDKDPIGTEVTLKCVKNKIAPPYGEGTTVLTFKDGIDRIGEIVIIAQQLGIVTVKGRTHYIPKSDDNEGLKERYTLDDELGFKIATSKNDFFDEVKKDEVLRAYLELLISERIQENLTSGNYNELTGSTY